MVRSVHDRHADGSPLQDVLQALPIGLPRRGQIQRLDRARLELVVGRGQLFDRRLQLFIERLQLLVGRLQLFIQGLDLFGGGLRLLVRDQELFVGGSQSPGLDRQDLVGRLQLAQDDRGAVAAAGLAVREDL